MNATLLPPHGLHPGTVAVLGLPYDENSSFLRGAALAPDRIREALHSSSGNLCTEGGIDLGAEPRLRDLGNLQIDDGVNDANPRKQIEKAVTELLDQGVAVLSLGGDHAITYPVVKAYAAQYPRLTLLHLDAHPDLYDEFEGNRHSHACPFARIMEQNLVTRLVQVGIRAMTPHQRRQAERFGVEVIPMGEWMPETTMALQFQGPLYLSLDLDVLDPAFAPGVSHHEPGGMSTRELLRLIQNLPGPLVGADIVEFNPHRDPLGITATVTAKLLKEIAARLLEINGTP